MQNIAPTQVSATFCLKQAHLSKDQLAARRLILLSTSAINFLSVDFSSSNVFCRTLAQSLRPSSFAHAIRGETAPANIGTLQFDGMRRTAEATTQGLDSCTLRHM